jgi:hypothetical protein
MQAKCKLIYSCTTSEVINQSCTRYWSKQYKTYRVDAMQWFIRKGDAVEENKPRAITFVTDHLVSNGKPKSVTINVWVDSDSFNAPVHKCHSVSQLVTLEANLTHLPKSDLDKTIQTRQDGLRYYVTAGSVEATFLSASTKYVLICQGKRYDTVTAEYV